ncbi:MAG TPA: phosphate regulon transcriptional regulator PhoB [Allosphingosinicella sp.]|nr:phosphate regulon transcriptional regulator PhoB [Allosphingosinicella sp.]
MAAAEAAVAATILVVEDDRPLAELLGFHLERAGYRVLRTGDGHDALALARAEAPDLILLDWMIEGMSGLDVCRLLRRAPETAAIPIIMLTARGEEADRLRGLETGADDYVTKPFSPRELVARVAAVLRRRRPALPEARLQVADIEMDLTSHKVRRAGEPVHLGPTEYRLLKFLMENPGRIFPRDRLIQRIWGDESEIQEKTINVSIRRLREALNAGGRPDAIRTVRASGYVLDHIPAR